MTTLAGNATGRHQTKRKRRRARAIRVWVTETEKAAIGEKADSAGLSDSGYLRVLGLGHQPKSMLDKDAVVRLIKLDADLGRVGGLLKLWLRDTPGQGASRYDVSRLYRDLQELKEEIRQKVRSL